MNKDELEQRRGIIAACLWMNSLGAEPGHLGQHQRALRRHHADHALRRALRAARARRHRRHDAHGRVRHLRGQGQQHPVLGVALPSRHHARPPRRRRHRPHPLALRHDARLLPQGHPGGPLHDRGLGRPEHPLQRLRHLWHGRAVDRGPGGARGPDLLHPGQPRHDRHRRRRSPRRSGSRSSSRPSPSSIT